MTEGKHFNATHGARGGHDADGRRMSTPEYQSWRGMKKRCLSPSHKAYPRYAGRGITVCERWRNSFENFLADMGPRPEGTCLERIDNSMGYEPVNCKWATRTEQNTNRCSTVLLTLNGVTKPRPVWAREYGISLNVLKQRLFYGWDLLRALTQPVLKRAS